MSKKAKQYSAQEKAKVAMEAIKGDLTTAQIISQYGVHASQINRCDLLGLNRSSYYTKSIGLQPQELQILNRMDEIFTDHAYYGNRRMMHVLRTEGYRIGRKKVRLYYQILGIEAIYPKMNLSKRNQAHKVYPYLLRDLEITIPNQVWSIVMHPKN